MYLQPIVEPNGKIVAAEALARLWDKNGNYIPPDQFIRIAETNGLIDKLGEQILTKLCITIQEYNLLDYLDFISINVAIAQCMRDDLSDRFVMIAEKYKINPAKIHCEITETQAIDSLPSVRKNLLSLKSYGFHIVLDDFGSGYANFNYLTGLPIDFVKFDKTVLQNSLADKQHQSLFAGLARLMQNLNISTVCEGIETEDQRAFVAEIGVDLYQGYLYSKPVPVDDFLNVLTKPH